MKKHDLIMTLLGAIFGVVMVTVFSIVLAESVDPARPPKDDVLLDAAPPSGEGGAKTRGSGAENSTPGDSTIQPAPAIEPGGSTAEHDPSPVEEITEAIEDAAEEVIDPMLPELPKAPHIPQPAQNGKPNPSPEHAIGLDQARLHEHEVATSILSEQALPAQAKTTHPPVPSHTPHP